MAKKFDAPLKQMIDAYSPDWAPWLCEWAHLPRDCRAEPLDSDLSIASNQADKLFRLSGSATGLLHLELESSWAGDAPDAVLLYNVLAHHRYGGPVHSVLLLLRREAWSPNLTGELQRLGANGGLIHGFHYTPVRLWDMPCEPLMQGPLGTLPLALLTDEAQPNLPGLLKRVDQRIRREATTPQLVGNLWLACSLLLGMRYDRGQVKSLFQGAPAMRDSSTYQMILDEGRAEGRLKTLRETLHRLGRKRFGPPRLEDEAVLNAITDTERLGRMSDRVLDATDWSDLLGTP
jgi:hypothetical protein